MSWRRLRFPGVARAGRAARRLLQLLRRPVLAVVVLLLARSVAGTVVTAVVGAVVLTVGLIWWWARVVEPRLFSAPQRPSGQQVRPVVQPPPSPSDAQRHLQFAEALAYVASHYLAECEREAGRDTEARR